MFGILFDVVGAIVEIIVRLFAIELKVGCVSIVGLVVVFYFEVGD